MTVIVATLTVGCSEVTCPIQTLQLKAVISLGVASSSCCFASGTACALGHPFLIVPAACRISMQFNAATKYAILCYIKVCKYVMNLDFPVFETAS